jgi:hypothetical protein
VWLTHLGSMSSDMCVRVNNRGFLRRNTLIRKSGGTLLIIWLKSCLVILLSLSLGYAFILFFLLSFILIILVLVLSFSLSLITLIVISHPRCKPWHPRCQFISEKSFNRKGNRFLMCYKLCDYANRQSIVELGCCT